jgi:hypothetical protein
MKLKSKELQNRKSFETKLKLKGKWPKLLPNSLVFKGDNAMAL